MIIFVKNYLLNNDISTIIMLRYVFLLTYLFIVLSANCQSHNESFDSIRAEFEKYASQARAEFEAYEAKARVEHEQFVKSIRSIWGGDSIINDTSKEWVEYDTDYRSRSIVDFEKGNILIQVAIDDDKTTDLSFVNDKLARTIERLLNSRGTSNPYKPAGMSEPLTINPILDDIVDFSKYDLSATDSIENHVVSNRPVPLKPTVKGKRLAENQSSNNIISSPSDKQSSTQRTSSLAEKREAARRKAAERASILSGKLNKTTLAQKIAQQSKKTTTTTTGGDGETRQVIQIQMSLVADNLSKNAYKYKDIVAEFSNKFQVEQPLIFAVMEVESAFNPEAKSWADAHGLMQLVPKYGGATAYQYVYKKSWIPDPSYLYNPRNNIELGTAYLRILMNTFAKVNDTHCRRLCVIAGYNTGPGNVSRAFNNTRNLNSQVFALINQYEYSQLYNHLISKLPAQETRNYVKKVTEKREKYLKQ